MEKKYLALPGYLVLLVPGKAQSSSYIDKNLVKLVSGAYTFCIHVATINPVQRTLAFTNYQCHAKTSFLMESVSNLWWHKAAH